MLLQITIFWYRVGCRPIGLYTLYKSQHKVFCLVTGYIWHTTQAIKHEELVMFFHFFVLLLKVARIWHSVGDTEPPESMTRPWPRRWLHLCQHNATYQSIGYILSPSSVNNTRSIYLSSPAMTTHWAVGTIDHDPSVFRPNW